MTHYIQFNKNYFLIMKTRILFNADCPICSAEICHYRVYAEGRGIAMGFDDLNQIDPVVYGVSREEAAKRLHVLHEGNVISGMPAFVVIWQQLPRYQWLAKIVCLPLVHFLSNLAYDYVLAPFLYATHLRRQRKRSK